MDSSIVQMIAKIPKPKFPSYDGDDHQMRKLEDYMKQHDAYLVQVFSVLTGQRIKKDAQ
jgi:hypothetical protein